MASGIILMLPNRLQIVNITIEAKPNPGGKTTDHAEANTSGTHTGTKGVGTTWCNGQSRNDVRGE